MIPIYWREALNHARPTIMIVSNWDVVSLILLFRPQKRQKTKILVEIIGIFDFICSMNAFSFSMVCSYCDFSVRACFHHSTAFSLVFNKNEFKKTEMNAEHLNTETNSFEPIYFKIPSEWNCCPRVSCDYMSLWICNYLNFAVAKRNFKYT